MRFSDASGHKIVSTTTAETVGKVDGFVVDVARPAVVALTVKKGQGGDVLPWDGMTAFGADAVTVDSTERLNAGEPFAELLGKDKTMLGKRVLATTGDELGTVSDVDFDPATGSIVSVQLDRGDDLAGGQLVGLGSYAVVVDARPPAS